MKKFNIYFQTSLTEWTKFNDEIYIDEDADFYVNWFNSLYAPTKFQKVEI